MAEEANSFQCRCTFGDSKGLNVHTMTHGETRKAASVDPPLRATRTPTIAHGGADPIETDCFESQELTTEPLTGSTTPGGQAHHDCESWIEEEHDDVAGPEHSASVFAGYWQPFPSWATLDLAANVLAMTRPVSAMDPVAIGALTKEEFSCLPGVRCTK